MPPASCVCPTCTKVLKAPRPEDLPAKVKCPGCGSKFLLNTAGFVDRLVEGPHAGPWVAPAARPQAGIPFPGQVPFPGPPPLEPAWGSSPPRTRAPLLVGVIAVSVLVLGAGIGVAVYCFRDQGEESGGAGTNKDSQVAHSDKDRPRDGVPHVAQKPNQDGQPNPVPVRPLEQKPANPIPKKPAPVPKPPPEFSLPEAQQKKVNEAIVKGVDYLKKCVNECNVPPAPPVLSEPTMTLSVSYPGAMNLVGLTLVACGVPATDPAVKKAADRLRAGFPNWTGICDTYDLALAILFLDRLGEARDKELIQAISLRLIAGQNASGGWGYTSPVITPQVSQALLEALKKPGPPDAQAPAFLNGYPVLRVEVGKPIILGQAGYHDNSLVQFAVLALWAAQKHGVPAQRSLLMAAERFRSTQNADGSWGYRNKGTAEWTFCDSMTCAGLLSLAVARGAEAKLDATRAFRKDPLIEKALQFVSQTVGKQRLPANAPAPSVHWGGHRGRLIGANAWGDLYYLWTLERMAVIYNLKKIGGKDWYPWGAEVITGSQEADGSWKDRYQGPVDTCFALLFLKRVNVAQDLTEKLQSLETRANQAENK